MRNVEVNSVVMVTEETRYQNISTWIVLVKQGCMEEREEKGEEEDRGLIW